MEAPTKRLLTSETHEAKPAASAQRRDLLSDDLMARLQNVGSRVRKSVAEGYSTPSASPLTQSPSKHHTTPIRGCVPPANQIYSQVFGSPSRAAATSTAPPATPSPLKRSRAALDADNQATADAMDCSDEDSDDDDDHILIFPQIVGGGFPNATTSARPVRPLRRPRVPIAQPKFAATTQQAAVHSHDIPMDYLPTNVVHARVTCFPQTVTVGGSADDAVL